MVKETENLDELLLYGNTGYNVLQKNRPNYYTDYLSNDALEFRRAEEQDSRL